VTSTTDLAWAAKEIGGDKVEVESLLRGTEDPHFVDARPDFISKVSRADVVCIVGLDLEVGWIPKVLSKSGRREVQPGGNGFCEVGRKVEVLEKPTGVALDRSMGDVHPSGNPHFWLSPAAFAAASIEIKETLMRVDLPNAKFYEARYTELSKKLLTLQEQLRAKLASNGVIGEKARIFEYHREFAYFANAYGLKSEGSLEEKPGVAPSAGRLVRVAADVKIRGVKIVLASETAPRKLLSRFEELSGLRVIAVPVSIHREGAPSTYMALQEQLVERVIEAHIGVKVEK
jgi:zinc/manganese transport system substrate-binding protein